MSNCPCLLAGRAGHTVGYVGVVLIDIAFDVRTDAGGRDPDQFSPTLRRYHQLLWSKPLPSGHSFDLDTTTPGAYLHHRSALGEFYLSSDQVIATYRYRKEIIRQLRWADVRRFQAISSTIGGMMIFPSNRVDGKPTINGARGLNRFTIADRIDLTVECIRRFYLGDIVTPLGPTLARYDDFFALFKDFRGYVDFFLLQDLVTTNYQNVRHFLPFTDFTPTARPADVASYMAFREASIAFVQARNERISDWASQHLPKPSTFAQRSPDAASTRTSRKRPKLSANQPRTRRPTHSTRCTF